MYIVKINDMYYLGFFPRQEAAGFVCSSGRLSVSM